MGEQTRWRIGWALGLIPAGFLVYAAFLKGLDPTLFIDQISAHKVTPASWSPALAYFFIAAELVIAGALALRLWPRWTHAGFMLMMAGFIGATSIAWANGNTKECGCFGRAVSRGPLGVIVEDGALIVVSAVAFYLSRKAPTRRGAILAGGILLPVLLAFTAFGGRLPADALVTGVKPGTNLADIPLEDLRKPHSEGLAFLVLLDARCDGCEAGAAGLNGLARERRDVNFIAVYSGTRPEAVAWRMKVLPAYAVAHATPRALRAWYRTLPACFLLKDGRVIRSFWGRIPTAGELGPLLPAQS
jgi:hypothetical protein